MKQQGEIEECFVKGVCVVVKENDDTSRVED